MTTTNYRLVASLVKHAIGDERNALANAANFVAVLYNALEDVNWLGLYLARDGELVLGPFQGQAAVARIEFGKGVCGTAALTRTTQRVADVHAFPGHIACDVASRSELVVPLLIGDELIAVLDIDSPALDRFSSADQDGIEAICKDFLGLLAERGSAI
jgi:L-methionine (R)-S-oxide reductase